MKRSFPLSLGLLGLLVVSTGFAQPEGAVAVRNPISNVDPGDYLDKIVLPEGFHIELYADDVPGARSMARGDEGTIFVGSRGSSGQVFAVIDKDGDYQADEVIELANELFIPNGVALWQGDLYVAETNRVLRFNDIEASLSNPPEPAVINDSYPSETHHGWRYINFDSDGNLYVSVGSPCNTCLPTDQHGRITRINVDGSDKQGDKQTVASGIRNSVGFDWHPETGELWFTDNGRDLWGDDRPPEELNHITAQGQHFGFPYEYGKGHRDGEFVVPDIELTHAALELPAHTAVLGMKFYTGEMFPEEYRNQILIPHHGSWNRSKPAGYFISLVRLVDGVPQPHEVFASGWLQDDQYWGRPVDLLQLPDGSLLVSDDQAGAIYRITYGVGE
ncbi:MAG: sorbosone dehydrogenase family protein [Proteobacteria bacterium]|jgi:glucose/arabinose dehydrogenase|nr:sorbosone dehydrogenase family protein [Pseudomonadota bacterium]